MTVEATRKVDVDERDAEAASRVSRMADELIAELKRLKGEAGLLGSGCLERNIRSAERIKQEMGVWQKHRSLYRPELLYVAAGEDD